MVDQLKSRAIVLYLGNGLGSHPEIRKDLVSDAFAPGDVDSMISYAESVVAEMNETDVDWTKHDLQSGVKEYRHQVRERHPELDDQAVDALGRAFGFWWK